MEKVTKIFDYVYLFFMTICKLFFIGMVVVTAYVVFGRFVLNNSPSWGGNLRLFLVYDYLWLAVCPAYGKKYDDRTPD